MRTPSTHAPVRLLHVACLTALLGWSQAAPARSPDQGLVSPGAQPAGQDHAQDAWQEDPIDNGHDETSTGTVEDVGSEDVDSEDVDSEDVESMDAVTEDDYEDDYEDDSWASEWSIDDDDESDDAIPVDDAVFGDDEEVWEVVDEDDQASDQDSFGMGGMASVRTTKKAPGNPQGKPKPPRQPGDDDDTVYSFGGKPVSALSAPWQAQILYPDAPPKPNDTRPAWQRQHYCGGALIAPDWVLTAAHCIDQQRVVLGFEVRLGVQDISKPGGTTYRIDHIVRHSQYNADSTDPAHPPNMYANDIALIHIVPVGQATTLDPSRVRPIQVNSQPLKPGVPVSATGWGVTGSNNADVINAVMLRVDLQVMPNPVCQQRPGYGPQKIKGGVFCASNPKQSTCRGDSGGPVVLTNGSPILVGLVSWGKRRCAGDGRPSVFTRIDRYTQWISQAMALPSNRNSLP